MTMQEPSPPTVFTPDNSNTRQLRDAFGKFATGVTVITTHSPDGPVCIVANSFSSVSLNPALVLWSVDRAARRFAYFERAELYAVHVLAAQQQELCMAVTQDAHALNQITHTCNMQGVPLLDHCLARFECHRTAAHDAGDHVIIVGQVQNAEMRTGQPLTFYAGNFGALAQG